MAFQITSACVNCWACVELCPNEAILQDQPHFLIDERKCTECLGDYPEPQCAAICPIEMAIVDELGEYLNPPGSLTGIPVEILRQYGLWRDHPAPTGLNDVRSAA